MNYEEYVSQLKQEFPGFEIKHKRHSRLHRAISWILFILTIGFFKRKEYLDGFVTTLFYTVYVPNSWEMISENDRKSVLLHEAVHMRQFKKERWFYPFKYLFFPLPIGLARYRLDYEVEAYAEEIVHRHMNLGEFLWGTKYERAVKDLSGPAYFWPTFSRNLVRQKLKATVTAKLKDAFGKKVQNENCCDK